MKCPSRLLVIYCWLLAILIVSSSAAEPGSPQLIESETTTVRYQPNWPSLDSRPLPAWYNAAKVGIFVHWGVYAVPSFGSEWFWTNWRTSKLPDYVQFMSRNYAPHFTYQQFAPDFTGELFNAKEWTKLFAASGAKYVVLTSKHHDGYAMWPSKYSFSWNSMDVGLHRDVVGELEQAVRKDGRLRFGLYHSLFEWYNPMYVEDKKNHFHTNDFVVKKVIPEMRELVQKYKPEIVWSDGDWEAPYQYWNSTGFLAWLYNESAVNATVVTNDRWGSGMACHHGGYYTCTDRYNPGVLQAHKWENALTLDRHSWGHRTDAKLADYLTAKELIDQLVSTVSCGGNLLVNVGPNKAGTIEPIFEERLRAMGKWLKANGEAVYEAEPWKHQNDTVTPGVWYTSQTVEKRPVVYAFVLDYPYKTGDIRLYALAGKGGKDTRISVLGDTQSLKFKLAEDHLLVSFPEKGRLDHLGLSLVWTLRIQL